MFRGVRQCGVGDDGGRWGAVTAAVATPRYYDTQHFVYDPTLEYTPYSSLLYRIECTFTFSV